MSPGCELVLDFKGQSVETITLGDGQPFGVAVTVLHVEHNVATVQDVRGRTYRTPSLMAVGEDVDAMLLAEEERAAQEYEEARRALYQARAQRRARLVRLRSTDPQLSVQPSARTL